MPGKWSAPRLRRHSSRHDRRAEPCQGTGNLAAVPDSLCGGDVTDQPTAPLVGVPSASQKRQQGEKPRAVKDTATLGEGPAMLPFPRPRGWQLPTVLRLSVWFRGVRGRVCSSSPMWPGAYPKGREVRRGAGKASGCSGRLERLGSYGKHSGQDRAPGSAENQRWLLQRWWEVQP